MRALCILTFSSLLAACGGGERTVWVPLSEGAAAHFVVVLERGETRVRALPAGAPVERFELASKSARLFSLPAGQSLDELGLEAGWQRLTAQGRPLPLDGTIRTLEIDGGRVTAPEPIAAADLPQTVRDVRLDYDRADPCLRLRSDPFDFGEDNHGRLAFLIPLPDGGALAGTKTRYYYRFDGAGAYARVTWPELAEGIAVGAAIDPRDGQLWMAMGDGQLWRGPVGGPLAAVGPQAPQPLPDGAFTLAEGGDFAAYLLGEDGGLQSFDGSSWTVLRQQTALMGREDVTIAWSRPGEVFFLQKRSDRVFRWSDDELSHEVLLPAEFDLNLDSVSSVHRIPGFGPLVGGHKASLFEWGGMAWDRHPDVLSSSYITVMAPLAEGVLLGGESGVLTQFHPTREPAYCEPIADLGANAGGLVRLGGGSWLALSEDTRGLGTAAGLLLHPD